MPVARIPKQQLMSLLACLRMEFCPRHDSQERQLARSNIPQAALITTSCQDFAEWIYDDSMFELEWCSKYCLCSIRMTAALIQHFQSLKRGPFIGNN
jgi:hypothetical protein